MDLYNKIRNAILEGRGDSDKEQQNIEVVSLLGQKKLHPVHSSKAYAALNHFRGLSSTKSARIVTKEEVEQIDEVGNTPAGARALASYIKKAGGRGHDSASAHAVDYGVKIGSNDISKSSKNKSLRKAVNRATGVERAVDRLTKEEAEQSEATNPYAVGMAAAEKSTGDTPPLKKSTIIKGHEIAKKIMNKEEVEDLEELSKRTLGAYGSKAVLQALSSKDPALKDKRFAGVNRASAKMYPNQYKNSPLKAKVNATNEEVEDLEELSKSTIKSYLDKSKQAGKDYPTSLSFRKSMEAQGIAKAKIGKTYKRRPLPDVKIKATNEEVEDLEELSKDTLKGYINTAKGEPCSGTKYTKRLNGRIMASKKLLGDSPFGKTKVSATEEVELDEAPFDAESRANDAHYDKQTERVKNMLDKYAVQGMSYRDAVKKIRNSTHILHKEITPFHEETEMNNIDEARGRPPKEGSEAWKRAQTERQRDPSEHIINRMGQAATHMKGYQDITYNNGKIHRVSNQLASRTLEHYRGLKPAQKAEFQARIAKSHEDHLDALQGK